MTRNSVSDCSYILGVGCLMMVVLLAIVSAVVSIAAPALVGVAALKFIFGG